MIEHLTLARNGTQILLSRLDPLQALTGQGSVIGSSETEIRINFDDRMDLSEDTWRWVFVAPFWFGSRFVVTGP